MGYVSKLVTEDSFDDTAKFVKAGQVGAFLEEKLSGNEKHLADISGNVAVVEIAPIAPTGPNPTTPQQIPPDAVQDATGNYVQPGKRLVAEVTRDAEERFADIESGADEAEISEEIDAIMSESPAAPGTDLVAGSVADVTANLGGKTDEELDAIEAAENAGKKRKGILDAIADERESRTAQA